MAIVRCDICGLKMSKTKRNYVTKVRPKGYPETAVICGLINCKNPGLVWLEDHELMDYEKGERIFKVPSFATKSKWNDKNDF